MKKILLCLLVLTSFSAAAEDGKELRKCINGYHILKRYTSKSLKSNECKLIVSYFDGQMTKILRKSEIVHNGKHTSFPNDKTEVHELKLIAGKYKLVFKADTYIAITSDTLTFAKREIIEIRVNLDSRDQPIECDKPVIYVYPPNEMPVYITLDLAGELGFTYPTYTNGWNFTASPDGTIKMNGNEYTYLFWEGTTQIERTEFLNEGFEIFTDSLVPFFEKQLTVMGLTTKEQQDFITYWVPRMSKYTLTQVHFIFNETFNEYANLNISPKPDNLFRVFMLWAPVYALRKTELVPQEIPRVVREGFTVIEWGGTEVPAARLNPSH
ncbi:MAG: hypothetical protein ACHQF2_07665 [Flavobacteriales bacterium]